MAETELMPCIREAFELLSDNKIPDGEARNEACEVLAKVLSRRSPVAEGGGSSGAVAPPFEPKHSPRSALDAEVLREVLFEMLEADDATLAFLLSVDPAKIGEAEWDRRNKVCRERKEKAREAAIAALGGRT